MPAAIAYFSPEYGITAALPQYSGGLGILAGDHLKTASDLGVPIIGVGLLYRHGYFTQSLSADGWQQEHYPPIDPDGLPLTLLRDAGRRRRCGSAWACPSGKLHAQVWVAQVGRVPLLLLDSDVEENEPGRGARSPTGCTAVAPTTGCCRRCCSASAACARCARSARITGHAEPEVFHTNEGHAGFLGLERIREYIDGQGLTFDEALEAVPRRHGVHHPHARARRHRPVPPRADRAVLRRGRRRRRRCRSTGSSRSARRPTRAATRTSSTWPSWACASPSGSTASRCCTAQVSREMFAGLWPGFDTDEVPIGSITNGVHAPTWVAREVFELGRSCRLAGGRLGRARQVAEGDLAHPPTLRATAGRRDPAAAARVLAPARRHRTPSSTWIDDVLDPDVLTIGFARRVPSYKRLTLMLRDPERLKALLLDPERPVQIVIAGKAHPADEGGKRLIQQIVRFADDARPYATASSSCPTTTWRMARSLVQGCDVWLNNPLRPLEACGTSGMKAALNGGLNLSIRDGWWDEWYDGDNGWAIPTADGVDRPRPPRRARGDRAVRADRARRSRRCSTTATRDGLPRGWLEMVRHSCLASARRSWPAGWSATT